MLAQVAETNFVEKSLCKCLNFSQLNILTIELGRVTFTNFATGKLHFSLLITLPEKYKEKEVLRSKRNKKELKFQKGR